MEEMQINNSRKFLQTRENNFPDLKGTPTTHQYREFLKLHITVKFQMIRVKGKILDDSRKKNQISYKTSDFSIATMETKITRIVPLNF